MLWTEGRGCCDQVNVQCGLGGFRLSFAYIISDYHHAPCSDEQDIEMLERHPLMLLIILVWSIHCVLDM